MKTKLTLTVRKSVISAAKRYAKRTGKSISKMFEQFFENAEAGGYMKSENQKTAERLLKSLDASEPVRQMNDKQLLKKHVARKFA